MIPDKPTCERLNDIADAARKRMVLRNTYNVEGFGEEYNKNHPNATQARTDKDPQNIKGKNPIDGVQFNTAQGGGFYDIRARQAIYTENQYTLDQKPYNCFPNNIVISLDDLGG